MPSNTYRISGRRRRPTGEQVQVIAFVGRQPQGLGEPAELA
jgi:hypothetical protein